MRLIGLLLGAALLLGGVPLMISPIPFGFVLVLLGLIALCASSPPFARFVRWLRGRFREVDAALDAAEDVLPRPLREPLEATEPDAPDAGSARLVRRADPRVPWRGFKA
jgi:hypothetical protein